jgi:hypothetical protein
MDPPVNFFHLGMSVSPYGGIRVARVGSTSLSSARASVVHRRKRFHLALGEFVSRGIPPGYSRREPLRTSPDWIG